ncbi:hypothetical protein [Pedobacter ginsengiterrae]|uniref:hypothetical protein n=1 Tax=Pedobacter ginsengiterrae TaxID=871696 RepID=UPI0031D8EBFC
MEKDDLIPSQQVGQQSNAIKEKKISSISEAQQFFVRASVRLLEVNRWQRIFTIEASHFQLFDYRALRSIELQQKVTLSEYIIRSRHSTRAWI